MAISLSQIVFLEPARARANLARVGASLPASLLAVLPTALTQVPDCDTALNNLERFTRQAGSEVIDEMARRPALLYHLLALFSHSRFLSENLIQEPTLLGWLGRDLQLARVKSKENLLEEFARFEATQSSTDPSLLLARFKRREYLRITLKDILGIADLAETTLELSVLADVLLEKALQVAASDLRSRYGEPQVRDAAGRLVAGRFAVVGLGKLGGNELNYSSDIDLLFLCWGDGETSGPTTIPNNEFFVRLAQRVIQLISEVKPEGPVFRVDLRLRPGGGEGDLAVSLPAAIDYYQRRAREWELQMLLKARPVAGNAALVREFLRAVEPCLYRGEFHFAAVETVLQAREQLDRKLTARSLPLNVKLSPGGIRDIEFLVQCLQRLYGQRDPWVRSGGTLVALQKLYDKGYLAPRDHHRLAAAYQFLRRLEHRLQLEHGHQTHTLPKTGEALALLARRIGLQEYGREAVETLRKQLDEHRTAVREIHDRLLPQAPEEMREEGFRLETPPTLVGSVPGEISYADLLAWFARRRSPVYEQLQILAVPERARKPWHRFLAAALASSDRFALLNAHASALAAAVELFSLSEPLGEILLREPELLQELPTVSQLEEPTGETQLGLEVSPAPAQELAASLVRYLRVVRSSAQRAERLREFYRRHAFRWGATALWPRMFSAHKLWQILADYSNLAEAVLQSALAIVQREIRGRQSGRFAMLALGRLATGEMDWGSDADLIFLTETPASRRETAAWRRVAEKLIHLVSSYTHQGTLFPVDPRLRPRGGEGELVQNAESVLEYFASSAEAWEAATYLKVRPVAGDREFAAHWCNRLRAVLAERFASAETVRKALAGMRHRLEEETRKTSAEELNFKTGSGGTYDLDFLSAFFALTTGAVPLAGRHLEAQIENLQATGLLADEDGNRLSRAAFFLRALDHTIRLAGGRTTSTLPGGSRREPVAVLLGRLLGEEVSTGELPLRLEQTCREVRAVFTKVFN